MMENLYLSLICCHFSYEEVDPQQHDYTGNMQYEGYQHQQNGEIVLSIVCFFSIDSQRLSNFVLRLRQLCQFSLPLALEHTHSVEVLYTYFQRW